MEEQILIHISKLLSFLHSVYKATNITYQVLDVNCYEHQNVLKRWVLPVTEETYECTCKPCFGEPEEMVNDIGDAIERAKATRNIINQVKYVQLSKNGIVNTGSNNFVNNSIKDIRKGKLRDSRNGIIETNENSSSGNKSATAAKDKGMAHCETQILSKRKWNTKLSKSIPFQTTYQKDFSARRSLATSHSMKCRVKNSPNWDAAPTTTKDRTLAAVDIDSLLEKVTAGGVPKNCPDMKIDLVSNVESKICFVHGALPPPVVHRCVNLKEAMNLRGVPSELVKLLKTYHQYISVDKLRSKRKVCGRDSFLQKLNESNQNGWDRSTSEPTIELCLHFLLIFVDVLSKNKTELSGNLLIKLEENLNFLVRCYNEILDMNIVISKEVLPTKKKPEFTSPDVAENCQWAIEGLWNRKSWSIFSGFKDNLKISYDNKEDCMLFQTRIQEIQKLHLQIQILEMLKNVFPHINKLQTDHVAISKIYKSCSALCNISTLSVPVLLKM